MHTATTMSSATSTTSLARNVAKDWVLPWPEIAGGYELPAEIRHAPRLAEMTAALSHAVGWANDIVSCPRKVEESAGSPNLPTVLAHERGCTLEEGVAEAVRTYSA